MRGFLFSLGFMGLFLLAINPQIVVEWQDKLLSPSTIPAAISRIESPLIPKRPASFETSVTTPAQEKRVELVQANTLPETRIPDGDNLPTIPNFQQIGPNESWIGATPCRTHIFDVPETLATLSPRKPDGILTEVLSSGVWEKLVGQQTYTFQSENGMTLKIVEPLIEYYDVNGVTFREAEQDIFTRKPLNSLTDQLNPVSETRDPRIITLANILSPSLLSYTVSGRNNRYTLLLNQSLMTSGFVVTLPRWVEYDFASPTEQSKWDDLFCNAAHHELGHLKIRLDIVAETLDGFTAMGTAPEDELGQRITDYREAISDRIETRQAAYHIYNGGGLRRGMVELPYVDLPFPWLEKAHEN